MNIDEIVEKAADLKMHQGYNCTQAVTVALAEESGLSEEQLKALGGGFCVGMGNMKATCGALIGAIMIAGLKTKGYKTLPLAKQISEDFELRCGALICKDLKTLTDGKLLCPCEECVRNAVRAYFKIMY